MINKYLIFWVLIFIISCKKTVNTSIKNEVLFNGENLNGWTIYGNEKWYVKEKLLICETVSKKNFGYLITKKEYKNFELNLEFKHETIGNSGVFLHSNFKNNTINGWQVEIGPPGHKTGGIHTSNYGWLAKPAPSKDSILKMNRWNKMKILLKNNRLTTWLNDIKMASVFDSVLNKTTGNIALQIKDEKAKIKWRNIKITEFK